MVAPAFGPGPVPGSNTATCRCPAGADASTVSDICNFVFETRVTESIVTPVGGTIATCVPEKKYWPVNVRTSLDPRDTSDGTAASIVGSIGFVGLVIPHAARMVVGVRHGLLLPASTLIGAIFMIAADVLSRVIIPGQVLPIGVVTALFGAPAFALILSQRRSAL